MLHRIYLCIALACSTSLTHADTLPSENDLRPLVDSIMKNVGANDIPAAFKIMQPFVVISDAEFQSAVLKSKTQREQYGARYGSAVGYECIEQTKVGASLVRIVCIEKTDKHVMPWIFVFYKSPKGWVLNSFSWNDQIQYVFSLK